MFKSYDQSIGNLTNRTNKKIIHYINSKLEKFDLTTEQWLVLLRLSKQDKISQKHLAEISGKDQPTLTRILDILTRKALTERHPSSEDRRSFSVHITDKGLNLTEKVSPLLEDIFKEMLNGISDEKLNVYREVLLQIGENINDLQQ